MQYGSDSIKHLDKLDHIRKRPTGYIIDTAFDGQMHIIRELIDNATDELFNLPGGENRMRVTMYKVSPERYQIAVYDSGRGIPVDKLIDVFVKPNTSGKFDTSAYSASAGTFGVGAKATVALSDYFRVVTHDGSKTAEVELRFDNIPESVNEIQDNKGFKGTFAIFEPDQTIFEQISNFAKTGDLAIIDLLKRISMVADGKFTVEYADSMIDAIDLVKEMDSEEFLQFAINESTREDSVKFSDKNFDRKQYLSEFFGVKKPLKSGLVIGVTKDSVEMTVELFVDPDNQVTPITTMSFVNGIMFTARNNIHIKAICDLIADVFIEKLSTVSEREFFKKHYKPPVWMFIVLKYPGAQFSGTTKHLFLDRSFSRWFNRNVRKNEMVLDLIEAIVDSLIDHFRQAFKRYSNKDLIGVNASNFTTKLKRPTKFFDCNTSNRDEAELFIIEGDSAKSDQGRDSETQASYMLSGKPLNSILELGKENVSIEKLKKNDVYKDVIRIIGITPGSNDLSNLNFGKIFITTDADTHGYHIANILISNLYVLCPALIESGKVYLVVPPLYSVRFKGNKQRIFVRDTNELNTLLAYHLYWRAIDIDLESDNFKRTRLGREEFVAFIDMVLTIGDRLTTISNDVSIDPLILEQLALISYVFNKPIDESSVSLIEETFGGKVRYDAKSNLIVLSLGFKDIIVPLTNINKIFYDLVLPLFKKLEYRKLRIYLTVKNDPSLQQRRVLIMQLYKVLDGFSSLYTIRRYKGLGMMSPKDRNDSCIAKETRRTYQITSVGDVDSIFKVMGKDSSLRKILVTDDTDDVEYSIP